MKSFRVIHLLVLLAMAVAGNLHLPALQAWAWAGMIVTYSRDNSMADALEMTFDGEHPCSMCTAIEKEQTKSSGDDSIGEPAPTRMILFSETSAGWIQTLTSSNLFLPAPHTLNRMTLRPEVPPPRFTAA